MFAKKREVRAGAMTALAILTSGCAVSTGSATSEAICDELARDLPTYSTRDTEETKRQGARFLAVFDAICAG